LDASRSTRYQRRPTAGTIVRGTAATSTGATGRADWRREAATAATTASSDSHPAWESAQDRGTTVATGLTEDGGITTCADCDGQRRRRASRDFDPSLDHATTATATASDVTIATATATSDNKELNHRVVGIASSQID